MLINEIILYMYVVVLLALSTMFVMYFSVSAIEIVVSSLMLVALLISAALWLILFAVMLFVAHYVIDRENALTEDKDKEYSSGYGAWAGIATCVLYFHQYLYGDGYVEPYALLFAGIFQFYVILKEFEYRKRGNTKRRRKKVISEALDKLLERCSSWLPRPQPKPVPIIVKS